DVTREALDEHLDLQGRGGEVEMGEGAALLRGLAQTTSAQAQHGQRRQAHRPLDLGEEGGHSAALQVRERLALSLNAGLGDGQLVGLTLAELGELPLTLGEARALTLQKGGRKTKNGAHSALLPVVAVVV